MNQKLLQILVQLQVQCAATCCRLHLIKPMGFSLDEKISEELGWIIGPMLKDTFMKVGIVFYVSGPTGV